MNITSPLLCKYVVQILTHNKTVHPLAKPGKNNTRVLLVPKKINQNTGQTGRHMLLLVEVFLKQDCIFLLGDLHCGSVHQVQHVRAEEHGEGEQHILGSILGIKYGRIR